MMKLPTTYYQPPKQENWTGRATNPDRGILYWYQAIQCIAIDEINATEQPQVALLGYACDEGVRRNLGRVGAVDGASAFRQRFAKVAYHHAPMKVADVGDVVCDDGNLEACQYTLSQVVEQLLSQSIFPIVVGGGHDIAYGHFNGIWNAIVDKETTNIGIINFDAHFDLRPLETQANSGTPFNQILTEYPDNVSYLALGIQQASNTQDLFDIAQAKNVEYLYNHETTIENITAVKHRLQAFIEKNDHIYITIDIDGFSSAYASGVSAPSPMGFTPQFVFETLEFILKSNKVISCDLAELNPKYDRDNETANLVARIVNHLITLIR